MSDQELVEQIVEDAIDKHWLPFEFKFIEWAAHYKAVYLSGTNWTAITYLAARDYVPDVSPNRLINHYKEKLL